jgi:hypothetical protein
MDHYKDSLWDYHTFMPNSPRMVYCLDPYWELALNLTFQSGPPLHLTLGNGESPYGFPSFDAPIGGEEGSPPIKYSPIAISLGSLLEGEEGSPGNFSNHRINLIMVHCEFDVNNINVILLDLSWDNWDIFLQSLAWQPLHLSCHLKQSQDTLIVLLFQAHHPDATWVPPCSIFSRVTHLDSPWVPSCCSFKTTTYQNNTLDLPPNLFWCFPLSSWASYWCLPKGPYARITRAHLRSLTVNHLGQDWKRLPKDFQWIYMDHYKDHDWTLIENLAQSTLPKGILQWESGESKNGEQVSGKQYFFYIAAPIITPVAVPKGNGEHATQNTKDSITIYIGESRIKEPITSPKVWDPGGDLTKIPTPNYSSRHISFMIMTTYSIVFVYHCYGTDDSSIKGSDMILLTSIARVYAYIIISATDVMCQTLMRRVSCDSPFDSGPCGTSGTCFTQSSESPPNLRWIVPKSRLPRLGQNLTSYSTSKRNDLAVSNFSC